MTVCSVFPDLTVLEFLIQSLDLQFQHINHRILLHLLCDTGSDIPISTAHLQHPTLTRKFIQILLFQKLILVQQKYVYEYAVVPELGQIRVDVSPAVDFQVIGVSRVGFREAF